METLHVGSDLHFVVADLNATKDTVVILHALQEAYPHASSSIHTGVQKLLGPLNAGIVKKALQLISEGTLYDLPRCPGAEHNLPP